MKNYESSKRVARDSRSPSKKGYAVVFNECVSSTGLFYNSLKYSVTVL